MAAFALAFVVLLSTPAVAEVVLIGDSLTVSAYKPPGWTVDARRRRSMHESRVNITRAAGRLPDALVVALGSNDVAIRSQAMEDDISVTDAQTVGCLVLTTVKVDGVTPFYNRRWKEWARRWNRAVWHSNAVVADWNARARNHPEWFREDGLHLTDSGAHAYGRLLGQTVRNRC
jgi:lysophospholipase L1-like esterase